MVNLTRLRSRSGHHPHHLNYQLHDKPSRERHLVSVLCSVFSILFLVLALSMKEWAKASNVSCDLVFGLTKVHVKHKNLSIYVKDYSSKFGCLLQVSNYIGVNECWADLFWSAGDKFHSCFVIRLGVNYWCRNYQQRGGWGYKRGIGF